MKGALTFLTLMLLLFAVLPKLNVAFGEENSTKPRVYRLLAIEQMFDSYRMKSAQYFISELLKYPNWNNSTDEYVSYIHLISMYNYSEVMEEAKPFWVGNLYGLDLKAEIINFLGKTSPGEIVLFYYCGHSHVVGHPPPPHSEFLGISSEELAEWLNSTLDQAHLTLVLDTCYSGYWLEFSPKATVLAACKKEQFAWGGDCGIFTRGVILSFQIANDSNSDGWLSLFEMFPIAKNYTETMVTWADQNPENYYGFAEGDIPLIQRDPESPFPAWDVSVLHVYASPLKVEPGSSLMVNVTIENQGVKRADIDVRLYFNLSLIAIKRITLFPGDCENLTFVCFVEGYGPYFLNCTASICPGEEDLTDNFYHGRLIVAVALLGDLNMDCYVDIADLILSAQAFGSYPNHPRWYFNADCTGDNYVGIDDICLIAKNFGKSYP